MSERPYVIAHMMSTVEGKTASGISGVDILGDFFDLYCKVEDKLEGKAWMLGRVTVEMFAKDVGTPLPASDKDIDNSDFIPTHEGKVYMFAVDTKGLLRWEKNTISMSNVSEPINLVVVVTNQTPKEYLAHLQENEISYIFGGEQEIKFEELLKKVKDKFGVEKLLLEGGGHLNGSVMAEHLVDEISMMICPIVANRSNTPSSFESSSDRELDITKYSLADVQKLEQDVVWLRYKKS